jgi:8-oxo-dGTP diphosphatase
VWLVRRKDTNQLATMGGFVQVGETIEATVWRELQEETGLEFTHLPRIVLLGVYSDPRRDSRRHTVSVTFAVHLDGKEDPHPADDVKEVVRIPLDDIEQYDYFADHKTILLDFRRALRQGEFESTVTTLVSPGDFANDIVRSTCYYKSLSSMLVENASS